MSLLFIRPPTRSNAVFSEDVVEQLRARPGEWALVRTYSLHGRSKADFDYRPPEVEIRLRYIRVHHPDGRTELYARWVPGGAFE